MASFSTGRIALSCHTGSIFSKKVEIPEVNIMINDKKISDFISFGFKSISKNENTFYQNIKKLSQREILIKQKKDSINKTKNISSKEQLEKDILNFNNDVEKFRSEKDKILKDFKLLKETKLDNFLKKINPIIQDYMKKNSIDIVLEKKQIFIGSSSVDITNEIIKLVNGNANNG